MFAISIMNLYKLCLDHARKEISDVDFVHLVHNTNRKYKIGVYCQIISSKTEILNQ